MSDYGQLTIRGSAGSSGTPAIQTQVYKATHNGSNERLDYMYRSFISFTYGGKYIEDFNLIATFTDTGFDRPGYADFEDSTSENQVVNGQMHWGTHIGTRTLEFELVTDEMTQQQLDTFLAWFTPGKARELILAEHPNRAVYARVKDTPQLKLTPFEKQTTVVLGGNEYKTSTTVYRGTIQLNFILDKPFWYSLINIFGEVREENGAMVYYDTWIDANGRERKVYEDKDAIKIALEDGIPFSNMIANTMTFGNDIVADVSNERGGRLYAIEYGDVEINEDNPLDPDPMTLADSQWEYRIAELDEDGNYVRGAIIAGITISTNEKNKRKLSPNDPLYFYYAGTAFAYPRLTFKINPHLNDNHYIDCINNRFTKPAQPYNSFTTQSSNISTFKFTTPSLFTAYNQAVYILQNNQEDEETLRQRIRESVKHYEVRKRVNVGIDLYKNDSNKIITFLEGMFNFSNNSSPYTAEFTFDGETGEAIGSFEFNASVETSTVIDETTGTTTEEMTFSKSTLTENVGDMVKSQYLIIKDRNYPDETGKIKEWSKDSPNSSYKLTHDLPVTIQEISLNYKNMYW